eukprot:141484_1
MLLILFALPIYMCSIAYGIGCCSRGPRERPQPPAIIRQLSEPMGPISRQQSLPRIVTSVNDIILKHCSVGNICDLEKKGIARLNRAVFPRNITVLDLSHNSIESVHDARFPPSLQELYLDSNQIKDVSNVDLSYLVSLKILSLDFNQIRSIQGMHLPPSLAELYVIHNKLQSFDNIGNLRSLQGLQALELHENHITSLERDLRRQLPHSLRYLGLVKNGLTVLNIKVPIALEVLDIRSNPLSNVMIQNRAECAPGLRIDMDEVNPVWRSGPPLDPIPRQRKLPKLIWQYMNIQKQCMVCCEEFAKGDVITTLPCMHQYHCKCIDPWLQKHTTCPDCRHNINQLQ